MNKKSVIFLAAKHLQLSTESYHGSRTHRGLVKPRKVIPTTTATIEQHNNNKCSTTAIDPFEFDVEFALEQQQRLFIDARVEQDESEQSNASSLRTATTATGPNCGRTPTPKSLQTAASLSGKPKPKSSSPIIGQIGLVDVDPGFGGKSPPSSSFAQRKSAQRHGGRCCGRRRPTSP